MGTMVVKGLKMPYENGHVKLYNINQTKQKLHSKRCYYEKVFWKYAVNLQENTHAEVWNHTSAWLFSCKFAAYFQNTFFQEYL